MRAILVVLAFAALVSGANIVNQRRQALQTEVVPLPWSAAAPTDARSPCPALNTLANHGIILPHNGRSITYDMLKNALIQGLGLSNAFGTLFAHAAFKKFANPKTGTFDLDWLTTNLHNTVPVSGAAGIEHSASLTREDRPNFDHSSDNTQRNAQASQVQIVLNSSKDGKVISISDFANARKQLWDKSFAARPALRSDKLHIQEDLIATTEGCLLLGALSGNSAKGSFQIAKSYAQSILLNERFPDGWTRNPHPLGIPELIACIIQQKAAGVANAVESWATDEFHVISALSQHWFGLMF